MEIRLKFVNTNSLNVRKGPGLRYPIVYSLPRDTPVTVRVPSTNVGDGWTWVERDKYPGLWVANELLRDPTPSSKIGVHLSQFSYDPSAFLAMLGRMYKAGKPMCLVKILGPSEQVTPAQVKAVSPTTTVIYRLYRDSDGGYDVPASVLFNRIDGNKALWQADFFQIRNEWNDWSQGAISLRLADMQWCELNSSNYRKRLLDPGWSTGNPPGDPMDTYGQKYIQDFMRYIRDHGHRFSLDEYDQDNSNWGLFRFCDHVFPNLPRDLQSNMPHVIFAEWGKQGARDISATAWLSMLRLWQARLANFVWIDGVATWCLGDTGGGSPGQNWQGDNFANKMELLEQVT